MKKVAVVTDSNSGLTQAQGEALGISVLPMPVNVGEKTYLEDVDLTQEQFYEFLKNNADVSTSQPSPTDVTVLWDRLLADHDQIVHIPMSSGLSGSCQTAIMLSNEEPYEGRVFVANNQRISVTQRQSAIDAKAMADEGADAQQIRDWLEKTRFDSSIYITLDTLKYLKKGGRITPAAAAIGTILRLKPVLQIQGEKLDAYAKARTYKLAKELMAGAIEKDIENRFNGEKAPGKIHLAIAHTDNEEAALAFREEILQLYPGHEIFVDRLPLSIACHIGPGSLALTVTKARG